MYTQILTQMASQADKQSLLASEEKSDAKDRTNSCEEDQRSGFEPLEATRQSS